MGIAKVPSSRLPVDNGDGTFSIRLTHGQSAIIDWQDVARCSGCVWFAHKRIKKPNFYPTGTIDGKQIRLHRHLLGIAAGDKRQVDHISGDVMDNRRCNLRIVTNRQNNQNRKTAIGRSGFKGVSFGKVGYVASITDHGTGVYLGQFSDAASAARAYDRAAKSLFGEYAATNESIGLLEPCEVTA